MSYTANRAKYERLSRELQSVTNRQRILSEMSDQFDRELSIWMGDAVKTQALSKNEGSKLHKLIEAVENDRYFSSVPVDPSPDALHKASVFIVSHDWAGAFGSSLPDSESTIRLPFESCMFEFVVNGKPLLFWGIDDGGKINGMMFLSLSGLGWIGFDIDFTAPAAKEEPLIRFIWRQIVAICVSLDAEIATTEVVRAPHKLNHKRQKQGKRPLVDYRTIDLSRRHNRTVVTATTEGNRKRLHFRRGHWRHYSGFKTWIKWQLVGNPDLGFIHSQYRL